MFNLTDFITNGDSWPGVTCRAEASSKGAKWQFWQFVLEIRTFPGKETSFLNPFASQSHTDNFRLIGGDWWLICQCLHFTGNRTESSHPLCLKMEGGWSDGLSMFAAFSTIHHSVPTSWHPLYTPTSPCTRVPRHTSQLQHFHSWNRPPKLWMFCHRVSHIQGCDR